MHGLEAVLDGHTACIHLDRGLKQLELLLTSVLHVGNKKGRKVRDGQVLR